MKFNDIDGGRNFVINGKQIDAVAGHENTLIIVECTTQRGSIRNKIEQHRGNIQICKNGFKKHSLYKKYKDFRFVIATTIKDIIDEDEHFASKKPEILIWNKKFLEYYEELYNVIRDYSKYNLLGEMGINPIVESDIYSPALKSKLGIHDVYTFYMKPDELLKISYVARREIGNEQYYQRMVNESRLKNISDFINKGGIFPNNIIIVFDNKPEFFKPKASDSISGFEWPKDIDFGILKFPNKYRTSWIIDGQHRLYAFSRSHKKPLLSVIAFHKLEKEKQAGFFIEINKEQKPVDANLIWDLEGQMRPNSENGKISNIVKKLNEKEPFKDLIYIPLEGINKKGKLKLTSFCVSIKKRKLVRVTTESKIQNPLYDESHEILIKKISDELTLFFLKLQNIFSDRVNKGFIFTNGGNSVMITLYERIMARIKRIPKEKDIEKYITPLKDYFEDKTERELKDHRERCASEAGKMGVYEELALVIQKIDEKFAEDVRLPYFDQIKDIEKELRKLIKKVLEKESPDWLTQNVPQDILDTSRRKMGHHGGEQIENFFDMGDCIKILDTKSNWKFFEPTFVKGKNGFFDKEECIHALRKIKRHRDEIIHRDAVFGFEDEKIFISFLKKIKRCIEECPK